MRNPEPIVIDYDGKVAQIRSAHLIGKDTDLRASGILNPNEKSPWDLRIDGSLNLGVIQDFNNDIVSSGNTTIAASVRGSLPDPQIAGRMELKAASFNLADVPNGLDNANGVILFDKRRATIESLRRRRAAGPSRLPASSGSAGLNGPIACRPAPITCASAIPRE